MNIDDYEIVEYKNCMFVYSTRFDKGFHGFAVDMGIQVANMKDKVIITFGLPKEIKKYIESRALCLASKRTKFPKYTAIFQSPEAGKMIDIGDKKDRKNIDFYLDCGNYVMTIEEAKIVADFTENTFFTFGITDRKLMEFIMC